jgi:phosphoglycerate dehydrogenase-like enzyme
VIVIVSAYDPHPYWNLPAAHRTRLEREFPQVRWVHVPDWKEHGFGGPLAEATAIFGWHLPEEEFARAARLRWFQSPATGVRRLLYPALVESEVVVTCARTVHAPFLAEQVMAWLLAHARRLREFDRAKRERRWVGAEILRDLPPQTLLGKTMLLVGYGATGRELAARAQAFGMRVWAVKRHPDRGTEGADRVVGTAEADRLLADAEVVVNLLPNTDATEGFFHRKRLETMREGVFFANVGRGTTVDEDALAELVGAGHVAGAGLDVFRTEPLPAGSPLWELDAVQISPHLAGVGHPKLWERLTALFERNLRAYLDGRPMEQMVDKRAGY